MVVPNKSNVPIGTVLESKFRITREIGRGGMAAVYEAENIDIGKRVAVKVLAAELITSRVVRERFIREARAASAVRSPHICDVYDSGMYEERPFLVMELLEGESLYDMLTRLRKLDVRTSLTVAVQTARGLGKAHEANIVHRDLKPENIFVTTDEEGGFISKLLDFGLAKFYEPTNDGDPKAVRLTREGALFGTPAYMSPEQARGQGEVDHRSDLWALGCIVYECLTGQTVWAVDQGVAMILAQVASAPVPRPSRLRSDLPPGFDGWFAKALDRDISKRFQSARELADALAGALEPGDEAAVSSKRSRQPSVHTEAEGERVDELMASAGDGRNGGAGRAAVTELADEPGSDAVTPEPSVRPSAPSSGVFPLLGAAVVVLAGYASWLHFLHPPGESEPRARMTRPSASAASVTSAKPRATSDPDTEPYAAVVREAQGLFAQDPARALERFKAAFALGSAAPARSLVSHAAVAVEEASGGCKVSALARPRPYAIEQAASPPTLVRTAHGALLGWVDNHADVRRRQGHVAMLDGALRRETEPFAVTPEANNVQALQLFPAGDRIALLYFDEAGKQSGVFVRQLAADGRIASPARRLAPVRLNDPSLAFVPIGEDHLVIWVESLEGGGSSIVAARLSPTLEQSGEPRRLALFPGVKGLNERVLGLDAVVAHGELELAFTLESLGQREDVTLLTTPLELLSDAKETPQAHKGKRAPPPLLGTLRTVATVAGRVPRPRLACGQEGCLVAWDEERGGAFVAFLQHGRPQPLWHRPFAEKGTRPTVVGDDAGFVLAWFEEARLRMARVGRDGLGAPSVLNRVNGLQPPPAVARGEKAGQWLVAWRDYEAAHLELFVLGAECP